MPNNHTGMFIYFGQKSRGVLQTCLDIQAGQSTERVTSVAASLTTWMPPWGTTSMSFAPMAVSSRIGRGYHNLSITISF